MCPTSTPRAVTRQCRTLFVVAALIFVAPFAAFAQDARFDVVITGGRIVDGTGSPWFVADIGIREGRIARIGKIDPGSGTTHIDAHGLVVAPGFVDMMGQTATPMLRDRTTALNLLTQGITTINAGEGGSAAPVSPTAAKTLGWQTMAEYFQLLELGGLPVNVVQTVGHTQVRRLVMGEDNRRPDAAELKRMQELVREAMQAGAIGVSTALIYPPAVYATTEEIAALAEVAGEHGGRYYTHMRNEGDRLLEAIDEAMEIGRKGGTPVHIFHLKAAGRANWGKMQLAIARIRAARAAGHQVTADIYPYINNGLGIDALIHPRHFGEGRARFIRRLAGDKDLRAEVRREMESTDGWENWFRHAGHDWNRIIIGQTGEPRYRNLTGKSVAEIARQMSEDPWDTFFHLVAAGSFALPETMTDANKILAMQQPFVSFCTDVGPAGGARSSSHPRGYGSFPRLLSRYVRDLGAISLPRAVAQASANACNCIMAYDRGRIAEGLAADIIVFDYEELTDTATFAEPHKVSKGMQHVLVNGEVVLRNARMTGRRPGRVLRGPGYDEKLAPGSVTNGSNDKRYASVDRVIQDFIREHRLPGASLAVSEPDGTVYARGYGYADVGTREVVTPQSLYRIASISKPITAVAILQLVDQGKLKLDDKVYSLLDHKPHTGGGRKPDPRQDDITIRHLLQHRGGWDRSRSFDAMFRSVPFAEAVGVEPPADANTIIRMMLTQPLDFPPGQRYAYSNYGYCLLGRVIEKLTGKTYEQYVLQHVLAPAGVSGMRIGATRLADRARSEVRYYHPSQGTSVFESDLNSPVPNPYGAWHLEAMDSHGAWIASATDLVRFAAAFDEHSPVRLLKPETAALMWQRPDGLAGHTPLGQPKDQYYGLGWSIQQLGEGRFSASHSGSLPGTNTRLIRRADGRNVAILFNTRVSARTSRVVSTLLPELTQAIDAVPVNGR